MFERIPVSHVSLVISDQPYGVKDPSVSILSPRRGWDFELRLVALEGGSLILGFAMCSSIEMTNHFAGLDLLPCHEYGNECGMVEERRLIPLRDG